MKLTSNEHDKIVDSVLKIQSVRASLEAVTEGTIPNVEQMEECLEGVDAGLRKVLGYSPRATDATRRPEPNK